MYLSRPRLHVGGRRRAPLRRPQSPHDVPLQDRHPTVRSPFNSEHVFQVGITCRTADQLCHDVAPRMRQHRPDRLHRLRCRPALSEPVGRFVPRPPTDRPSQRTSSTPRASTPTTQRTRRVRQHRTGPQDRTAAPADWSTTVTDPKTTPQHHPPARLPYVPSRPNSTTPRKPSSSSAPTHPLHPPHPGRNPPNESAYNPDAANAALFCAALSRIDRGERTGPCFDDGGSIEQSVLVEPSAEQLHTCR